MGVDGLKMQFGSNLLTFGGNAASVYVVLIGLDDQYVG
jgi:hypothetical protein